MTTRGQILRSSTPGQVPAAGTRLPGEVWTTFPDLQLGVIDTSRNAQKLIAVRFFSTLANYVAGDFVIQAGVLYAAKASIPAGAFNSSQWTRIGAATDAGGPYLAIAGGTLTGALLLAADPGAALGAATKQYVDGKVTAAPYLPLAGGTLTGPVTLSGPPTIPLHAATKAYVDSGAFVPIGGGTMTGDLILNRDAQVALGAATKQQVDARGAGDNRLINGDMRIDQRNGGASGTGNANYTVDRWAYYSNQASKGAWQQGSSTVPGFPYCLKFTSSSAYASVAADYFEFAQSIEADMIPDFAWGTANAQPVTLSFWVLSSKTGTFSGSVQNYAATRSYPFSYSVPAASTWTRIVVTIPGDTAGTWVLTGNAGSVIVVFDLGSGSNYRGSANTWASAGYTGATGTVSVVATNGATFYVTGVKLEIGSVATPYPRQSLAKSMADCQRYYEVGGQAIFSGNVTSGSAFYNNVVFKVNKRAAPTVVCTDQGVLAFPAGAPSTAGGILVDCFLVNKTANVTGSGFYQFGWTANAEL